MELGDIDLDNEIELKIKENNKFKESDIDNLINNTTDGLEFLKK